MTNEQTVKVFISKYALTKGILEKEGRICGDGRGFAYNDQGYTQYVYKPDFHESKEEAVKQAEKMLIAKIVSLRNQLKKFEKMRFE